MRKLHTHKNTPFMWDMINFIVWSDVMKLQLIIGAAWIGNLSFLSVPSFSCSFFCFVLLSSVHYLSI